MIITIVTIWATGFFVMGTERISQTVAHPPQRGITLGEEITLDTVFAAAWPVVLAAQVNYAVVKQTEEPK